MLRPNQMLVWVSQGTAADRRTGFVAMTRAAFIQAESQGRAQDPRVGALHLKYIRRDLFVAPPLADQAPEPRSPAPPLPVHSTRPPARRRSSSSEG